MKYYFLLTYLPDIHRDDRKIKVPFGDILAEREYIGTQDWQDIELLLLGRDIQLVERLLSGKDLEIEHTLYDKDYWKEQTKAPKEVPLFLEDFLQAAATDGFDIRKSDQLYDIYYTYVAEKANSPLLRDYFQFEKDLKNILAAIRARRQGLPPSDYIIGKGELVEQLGLSSAEDFGLGQELPWIEQLLGTTDPLPLEETVEQLLWQYLDEKTVQIDFDFDLLLAYLIKLQLLEKRLALSEDQGMNIVRKLGQSEGL